jgi:micrococcal nuclease
MKVGISNMYQYNCLVKKVIDGDTIEVDIDLGFGIWKQAQRVRLNGIDTPESRTTDLEEKKHGLMAKAFVELLLMTGKPVQILTLKDKDADKKEKFGRILADFMVLDPATKTHRLLTALLVENHLAVEYHGQSKALIQEQHLKNRKALAV